MKSRLTSDNFKSRWFILFRDCLRYYEGSLEKGLGKEKGVLWLNTVHMVEEADLLKYDDNKKYGFQIGYASSSSSTAAADTYSLPAGPPLVLYVNATTPGQRTDWIKAVRDACVALWTEAHRQQQLLPKPAQGDEGKYHHGIWTATARAYSCCGQPDRLAPPCIGKTWKLPSFSLPAEKEKPPVPLPRPLLPPVERVLRKVVALYDYRSNNPDDLDLVKGEEYDILDDTQEQYWWKARDRHSRLGFLPSNYVVDRLAEKADPMEKFSWFRKDMSRPRAETELKTDGREGCFVVRDSATSPGNYTLALFTKEVGDPSSSMPGAVRHYHIKKNALGMYYLSDKHPQRTIEELINYHKLNAGGLVCRLRHHPDEESAPSTLGLEHGKYKLEHNDLRLQEELGKGNFGCVRKALYKGNQTVAVKMMLENTMQEDEFALEAKNMMSLRHSNLVQLYGFTLQPFYIVTEFMENGCLLNYLKRRRTSLLHNVAILLDMCIQVAHGMKYLESQKFIHRDLAARNCLVGKGTRLKVGDFGLARFVLDDEYISSSGAKFPIKWASPEVLSYMKFSSKSDVWAFGILMWEIFTAGEMPYRRVSNPEVVDLVCKKNYRLERPTNCPKEVYDVMLHCWEKAPESRPSFEQLTRSLPKINDEKDYVS